jgi:hypothetical protein
MLARFHSFRRCWQLGLAIGFMALAATVTLPGCGPAASTDDLGKVVYDVPNVPGADKVEAQLPPGPDKPSEHSHAVSGHSHADAASSHANVAPSHANATPPTSASEQLAPKASEPTLEEMLGLAPKPST